MKVLARSRLVFLAMTAAAALTACGGDMDDLDAYINEVKARPGGRIVLAAMSPDHHSEDAGRRISCSPSRWITLQRD